MMNLFPETISYELLHFKTKEPTGITLELVGSDDDRVYQAQFDAAKSLRKQGTLEPHEVAFNRAAQLPVYAACIVG